MSKRFQITADFIKPADGAEPGKFQLGDLDGLLTAWDRMPRARHFNLANYLMSLHGNVDRSSEWPWAIVVLDRDYPIGGSIAKARRLYKNAPMTSMECFAGRIHHVHGMPVGVLCIPYRPNLAGMARELDFLGPVWRDLRDAPPTGKWVLLADPLDKGLVAKASARDNWNWTFAANRVAEMPLRQEPVTDLTTALAYAAIDEDNEAAVVNLLAPRWADRASMHPSVRMILAVSLWATGEHRRAQALTAELVRSHPTCSAFREFQSRILLEQGRHQAAMRAATETLRLDPYNHDARRCRAHAVSTGSRKAALRDWLYLAECHPRDASLWLSLGMSQFESSFFADAESSFLQAAILRPGWPTAINNLAMCRIEQGDTEQALQLIDALLHGDRPLDAHPYHTMGYAFMLQGRRQEAEASFRMALAMDPDHPESIRDLRLLQSLPAAQ